MKNISFPSALLLCVVLSACKLEIAVPTSGSVTTDSGNINCAAGQICTENVTDIYFDESFVAQPDAGFVFTGWKAKVRGFCGDADTPCVLSTALFAGSDILTSILDNPNEVFYLEPRFQSTGFESLFIGHSFFKPFAKGLPDHAAQAGIMNHSQSIVFSGGSSGAPEALWNNASKRDDIQGILNGGDIELFGMTYHTNYPSLTGYKNWIDYALAQNPDTRFAIGLPWTPYPSQVSAATYARDWHEFHTDTIHAGITQLRSLYPGTDIFCVPYGQSAAELRHLFADGTLDDVDVLQGEADNAIYTDDLGHAGDILVDLGRLVWLNAFYDVDLTTYAHNPGYNADLKAIAQDIMDGHDPVFDAPYR
jgi:hypothetical protein